MTDETSARRGDAAVLIKTPSARPIPLELPGFPRHTQSLGASRRKAGAASADLDDFVNCYGRDRAAHLAGGTEQRDAGRRGERSLHGVNGKLKVPRMQLLTVAGCSREHNARSIPITSRE